MRLICMGDSLTYGLGVPVEDSWTAILDRESGCQVINKGISGDTSGGMLARLERDVLADPPDLVLLMGGSNDFIMGCDISQVKANMMAIIHQLRAERITVALCSELTGDTAHTRPDWAELADFWEVAEKLEQMAEWNKKFCQAFQIPHINLHDRFAQAAAGRETMYFFDGVHPNRAGHRLIADILLQEGFRTGIFS